MESGESDGCSCGKAGFGRRNFVPKVPRKRMLRVQKQCRASPTENWVVEVGVEIHSIMIEMHKPCRATEAFSRQSHPLELERTHPRRQAGSTVCRSAAAGSHLSQILSHGAKRTFIPGTQEKAWFYKGRCQS